MALRPINLRDPGEPALWLPATQSVIVAMIEYDDVVDGAATVEIGKIPAGGRYLDAIVKVITAFNAGSADALTIGISTDYDYLLTDGHPTIADSQSEGELLDWESTTEQTIYARYTHSGAAPTTGKAICIVTFAEPLI